ncbi:putative Zn-dependent protease [Hoeflea sp. IMCC20628]|uniref:zinc metallopeptidase n=1 Tax=Hoeflea sp. IMCC20628 TaxID=1620421 RepID=UPI00063B0515|nr:zinc metallopeptidase [Hoeflea sp. IMCC20628]AKH99628.1 putative Zn-dependent protease [Hoeflea sp. IMCC20628]
MAILGIIGVLAVLAAIYGPQYWVGHTMRRHSANRPDFPGTGGEMAQHLVERLALKDVRVEATDAGDHYDPEARTVRLSQANYNGASLTAVAVAAHEVGHALQHHRGERGLALRQSLVRFAMVTDRIALIFFIAALVLAILLRAPVAMLGMAVIGIGLLAIRIVVHLVTLPVEYDASFNKALPILREGGYLGDQDLAGARSVLKAAALTYVASALMSLLNLARWVRTLR